MTSAAAGPVRLRARLDTPLSRWLWLVKWLLALPHLVVLALLWVAFAVLSVVASVAILVTGRYPRSIFEINLGVLRWTWRVVYYTYGAFGTDRYPPFTLAEVPDYPATLDVAYPEHLSRGLVLVKWLLALSHYLVLALFLGSGGYVAYHAADAPTGTDWPLDAGLIQLLALIAGVALLVTGRYPRGVFDLLLGLHRWVLRVAAYAALMTDAYPPFRLDLGGDDPADLPLAGSSEPATPTTAPAAPAGTRAPVGWSAGRVTGVVIGSLMVVAALGTALAGGGLTAADRGGRDADGFVTTGPTVVRSTGYAVVLDPVALRAEAGGPALGDTLGRVRFTARGDGAAPVFVGIGPAPAVAAYLRDVERTRLAGPDGDGRAVPQDLPGGPPASPPVGQGFWVASAAGPGAQQVTWTPTAGRWAVVVMNADGSRAVAARVTAGATAPVLGGLGAALLVGAAVTLVVGAVLIALALPRSRA